jgi:hypothetical protein
VLLQMARILRERRCNSTIGSDGRQHDNSYAVVLAGTGTGVAAAVRVLRTFS